MNDLQIFDDWSTYEKVVANDYMHHCKFFEELIVRVETRLEEPLAILDIGCGDGKPVIPLLDRFETSRYVGVDQSAAALDRAHKALAATGICVDLRSASMLDELKSLDDEFDLVIASYSLHHLDRDEKQVALKECRRLLRTGGMLAVIDVFLEEGESRQTYFDRWQKNARQTFAALLPQETDALIEHVRSCDIPESVSTYRQIGKSAGFEDLDSISEDRERLNRLLILC